MIASVGTGKEKPNRLHPHHGPTATCFAIALLSVGAARAGTIAYGGSGTLSANGSWTGGVRPGTLDEAIFTGSLPSLIGTASGTNIEFGNFLWNSNSSSQVGLNTTASTGAATQLRLSNGAGSTAAIANGGSTGDLILMGTNATDSTLSIIPNAGIGTNTLQVRLLASGNFNVVNAGATLDIVSRVTDNGEGHLITKSGAGTLILRGSKTLTGVTLAAGTLGIGSSIALGNAGLTINGGRFGSAGASSRTLDNAIHVGGNFILGGVAAQSITLNGNINLGGAQRSITLENSATLVGIISNGGLLKTGNSALTLTGESTYTGATSVTQGVLTVNGSLANTSTTVSGTGSLHGSGSIAGPVTIQAGGALAPGDGIGAFTTGALAFESGATFAYETDSDTVAGDLASVSGNLTLPLLDPANLTLTDLGSSSWTAGDKLSLFAYTGSWNGGLFAFGGTPLTDGATFEFGGSAWAFDYDDLLPGTNFTGDPTGTTFVTMTAIPEPAVALLGGLGLLALARRRRS